MGKHKQSKSKHLKATKQTNSELDSFVSSQKSVVSVIGPDLPTTQLQTVQGPTRLDHDPIEAIVDFSSNLHRKYLGTGLVGFGPYLEVLSTHTSHELICKHGYKLLRQMSTDSEVDACLDALIQPASSQPMTVDNTIEFGMPGYETAEAITDFIKYALDQFSIDQWRRQQLRYMLTFGNSVSEIDWDVLGPEAGPWSGNLVISNLRLQEPENYGFIVDRYGKNYGVAPLNNNTFVLGNMIPLTSEHVTELEGAVPRWKLAVWSWDQRGTDPRGTSILIPAYIPWWSKQRAMEEWACWLGRYAQPSLWATPGPDAVPVCVTDSNGNQIITQPTEALLKALLNFRSASVLALPYGSQVNVLKADGSVDPFLKSIDLFDEKITRSLLGQHLATNGGEGASRSAADLHAMILRQYVASIRMYITRQVQREIINPMVIANFGAVAYKYIPKVNLGDTDGFAITITELAVLFQSGYLSEDQLPIIDKIIGIPVRKTMKRVGAGNLPPYIPTKEEAEAIQAAQPKKEPSNAITTSSDKTTESGGNEGSGSSNT